MIYDVIIIGSGVVGSNVARELSRYQLKTAVLEKMPDVCCSTSGRNSGVLHAGFNNTPGTKMAKYCVQGNAGFDRIADELDVPYKRTGKLIVGFTEEDKVKLTRLKEQGEKSGVPGLELVDRKFIRKIAPFVEGEFALWSGNTAILTPYLYTIALAENAAKNGVAYYFDHEVTAIRDDGEFYHITAGGQDFTSRFVINSAGLYSDQIARMLGTDEYTIHPCKGEYFIFDKLLGEKLPVPAYPVPDVKSGGLGIHLTPTIEGNVLVGPSNEYLDEKDNYATEKDVLDMLLKDGSRIFPYLTRDMVIRNFTGLRPKLVSKDRGGYHDFIIERREETPRAINLVGIESPGLTASNPIAREVVELLGEVTDLKENKAFDPHRRSLPCFRDLSPEEKADLVLKDPDFGEIICRCESITKAEVLAAIRNPLGVSTMTGIKYRCRSMMGRCQGGYCQMRISELLMQEKGITDEMLRYDKDGAYVFTGKIR